MARLREPIAKYHQREESSSFLSKSIFARDKQEQPGAHTHWDPALKEVVCRISAMDLSYPVVGTGENSSISGCFSAAVRERGDEGCSLCWETKGIRRLKDPLSDSCLGGRHSPWSPVLLWRNTTGRHVLIRPRPKTVVAHFRICRYSYGRSCQAGRKCRFPHSEEERVAWTLDRDGVVWEYREPRRCYPCRQFSRYGRCRYKQACEFAHGELELREWRQRVELYRKRQKPRSADRSCPLRVLIAEEVQLLKDDPNLVCQVLVKERDGLKVDCQPDAQAYIASNSSNKYEHEFFLVVEWPPNANYSLKQVVLLNDVGGCKFRFADHSRQFEVTQDGLEATVKTQLVDACRRIASACLIGVKFVGSKQGSFRQDVIIDVGSKPYVVKTLSVDICRSDELKVLKEFQCSLKEVKKKKWSYKPSDLCQIYTNRDTDELSKKYPLPDDEDSIMEQIQATLSAPITSSNYKTRFRTLITVEELARNATLCKFNRADVPMKIVSDHEGIKGVIDLGERLPNAQLAAIRLRLTRSRTVYEVPILYVHGDSVTVFVRIFNLAKEDVDRLLKVDVQFVLDRTHLLNLHQAVERLAEQTAAERLIPSEIDAGRLVKIGYFHDMTKIAADRSLNPDQQRAIQLILSQRGTLPVIVNGPFGTGKTYLLAEAIRLLLIAKESPRILVCTHSNHAADLYVKKIHEFNEKRDLSVSMQRVYYKQYQFHRIEPMLQTVIGRYCRRSGSEFLLPTKTDLVKSKKLVVVTTLITSMQLLTLNLPKGFFTHIIIDEAAQVTEPETIAPFSLADSKTVVVLAGDHMQINPVVQSDVARIGKLQRSLFRRLYKALKGTVATTKVDLTTNYRCHYDILEITSKLFYGAAEVNRSNSCGRQDVHPVFRPVSFYACQHSCARQSPDDGSYLNSREASTVVSVAESVLETWPEAWRPYVNGDLCIITSEKNQERYLRRLLQRKGLQEKFQVLNSSVVQGREFRACLISTVMTHEAHRERRGDTPDFLSDAKLLNTAMTRAQSLVLVVGDPLCLCASGKLATVWQEYIRFCNKRGTLQGELSSSDLFSKIKLLNSPLNPNAISFQPVHFPAIRHSSPVVSKSTQDEWLGNSSEEDSDDDMIDIYRKRVAKEKAERDRFVSLELTGQLTIIPVENREGFAWELTRRTTVDDETKHLNSCFYDKHIKASRLAVMAAVETQKYVRATLKVVSHEEAYAINACFKRKDVVIRGMKRRNRALDGEEVLVSLDGPKSATGTVVGIFEEERPREWLCVLSRSQKNVLIPLDNTLPKILNLPRALEEEGLALFERVLSQERKNRIQIVGLVPLDTAINKIYVVQLLKWKRDCLWPLGIVVEELDYGLNLDSATRLLTRQYLPESKSDGELEAIANEGAALLMSDIPLEEYRRRGSVVTNAFTVDAEGSDDLDDALSFDYDSGSHTIQIGVYVSDVTYYVSPSSPIDECVRDIGMSFYTYDGKRKKSMLPERLTTNVCSLVPDRDRLVVALLVDFDIASKRIVSSKFQRRIIRSCCKLSYKTVEGCLEQSDNHCQRTENKRIIRDLTALYQISVILREKRLGEHCGRCQKPNLVLYPKARALVEEFMILANQTVARNLMATCRNVTPLLRQGPPDASRANEWITFTRSVMDASFTLPNIIAKLSTQSSDSKPRTEQDTSIAFSKHHWMKLTTTVYSLTGASLRDSLLTLVSDETACPQLSMAHAGYFKNLQRKEYICAGCLPNEALTHHDLGSPFYTHFTSPIRRYIDILTHRLLIAYVINPSSPVVNSSGTYTRETVVKICRHCSRASIQAKKFEAESRLVSVACEVKERQVQATAVVESLSSDSLRVYIPDVPFLSGKEVIVRMSSLNAIEVKLDESPEEAILNVQWSMRVVECPAVSTFICRKTAIFTPTDEYQLVPIKVWKEFLDMLLHDYRESKYTLKVRLSFSRLTSLASSSCVKSAGEQRPSLVTSDAARAAELPTLPGIRKDSKATIYDGVKADTSVGGRVRSASGVQLRPGLSTNLFGNLSQSDNEITDGTDSENPVANSRNRRDHDFKRITSKHGKEIGFSRVAKQFRRNDLLSVRLFTRLERGILKPALQQLVFGANKHVCLQHNTWPEESFAMELGFNHCASLSQYRNVQEYITAWMPVLDIESATCSIKDSSDMIFVRGLPVTWRQDDKGNIKGLIKLDTRFAKQHCIPYQIGDYACLTYDTLPTDECVTTTAVRNEAESTATSKIYTWVAHCRIVSSRQPSQEEIDDTHQNVKLWIELSRKDMRLPKVLMTVPYPCTAQFIAQSMPYKRMRCALETVSEHCRVAQLMCLGRFDRLNLSGAANFQGNKEISEHVRWKLSEPKLSKQGNLLNSEQCRAVDKTFRQELTLIQGPPGTGKTVTGLHIAFHHFKMYSALSSGPKKQVLYCCPSNQTVDDVAEKLSKAVDATRLLRIYGDSIEKKRFPGLHIFREHDAPTLRQVPVDDERLKYLALHYRIRDTPDNEIKRAEKTFRKIKDAGEFPSSSQREQYESMVSSAEARIIRRAGIILCTCNQAGSRRLIDYANIELCIVDEAGQCTEPETLVAIAKAQKVVLIGDHKQLQPVVQNNRVRQHLSRSMFERIAESGKARSKQLLDMLTLQYRMHHDICRFPSETFYEGHLRTDQEVSRRRTKGDTFWLRLTKSRHKRKCFVHVQGNEDMNHLASEGKGGEGSKFNWLEASVVVKAVVSLRACGVDVGHICILTPYTAQKAYIEYLLKKERINVKVLSVFASQGSEAEYIILSTVRSLPQEQIVELPSKRWEADHLGFVTDEHQMNVALTRAKQGLIIIGNSNLLGVYRMWRNLIDTYKQEKCFIGDQQLLTL